MSERRMWMVRRKDSTYLRPMPESVLIELIETGKLDRRDEACLSTSYWFPLGDAYEVKKFLGNIRLEALTTGLSDADTATHTDVGITRSVESEAHAGKMPDRLRLNLVRSPQNPPVSGAISVPSAEVSVKSEGQERNPAPAQSVFLAVLVLIFSYILYLIYESAKS